jgi:hypothetical protein
MMLCWAVSDVLEWVFFSLLEVWSRADEIRGTIWLGMGRLEGHSEDGIKAQSGPTGEQEKALL